MKEEKIVFRSKSGTRLEGIFSYPKNRSQKIIVICHGFTGLMDEPLSKNFARYAQNKGYAAFRFNFFAHGKSSGDFVNLTLLEEKENLEAALKIVSKKFKKIGLVGHSLGGLIATTLANKSDAIVLWAPALLVKKVFLYLFSRKEMRSVGGRKIPELIKKNGFVKLPTKYWGYDYTYTYSPFKFGVKLWREIKKFNSVQFLRNVRIPTKFILAEKDGIVATKFNRRAFSYIKAEKDFKIIKGATHDFQRNYDESFKLTIEWFDKFL